MDDESNETINPSTSAKDNTEPVQPTSEENLIQPNPIEPEITEEPVAPAETSTIEDPDTTNELRDPIPSATPAEPVSPTPPIVPKPSIQQTTLPVETMAATALPKKKNTNLIIAIILGVIAIGCAIAAVLAFTVFKPTSGGSGNAGGSTNGGTDTPTTNTVSTIDSCPGCVFAYTTSSIVYSSNYDQLPYESIDSSMYKTDWHDVVNESGHGAFLGFVLDDENKPTKMYACGVLQADLPYCLEGSLDDKYGGDSTTRIEIYEKNISVLNSVWDTKQIPDYVIDYLDDSDYKLVDGKYQGIIYLEGDTFMRGTTSVYDQDWVFCSATNYGTGSCNEYWSK